MSTQDRSQWLQQRRRGIGGSDVAAILGLSKWRTPMDVYLDKCGELPEQEDNAAMHWGRTLEPIIRQEYANRTGATVIVPDNILAHPQYPFMLASLDGVTDALRVFEAKTARTSEGWGEPGSDEIPDAYALQVQHYMAVTGYQFADVAVLIGGSDFRIYTVAADHELQDEIIHACRVFWERVESGNPPEPITAAEAQRAFGQSPSKGEVQASAEDHAAWHELIAVGHSIKELEAREQDLKATLMKAMGEHGDTLIYGGKTIATWKLPKPSRRFNAKRFTESHPELAEQFTEEAQASRRLLIKE